MGPVELVRALNDMAGKVQAYDPAGMQHAKRDLDGLVALCGNAYECAENADALVIVASGSSSGRSTSTV